MEESTELNEKNVRSKRKIAGVKIVSVLYSAVKKVCKINFLCIYFLYIML